MCVHHKLPAAIEEAAESMGTEVTDNCEPTDEC